MPKINELHRNFNLLVGMSKIWGEREEKKIVPSCFITLVIMPFCHSSLDSGESGGVTFFKSPASSSVP